MRTRTSCILLLVLQLAAAPSVWPQSPGALSEGEQVKLRSDVAAGKYGEAQNGLANYCAPHFENARSPKKTVDDRLAAADLAVQCVSLGRATMIAADADLDSRIRAREVVQPLADEADKVRQIARSESEFKELNWGLGFGFSVSSDEAIDEAVIVNGVVRVRSQKKQQPRVLFEFHKYLWCNKNGTDGTRGCGPFVAVAATEDKVLSGVGFGFMYGFKSKQTESEGFSVGVGAILDAKVKDLAEGFQADAPPPAGETEVRYEEKSRWSALIFVTRTF